MNGKLRRIAVGVIALELSICLLSQFELFSLRFAHLGFSIQRNGTTVGFNRDFEPLVFSADALRSYTGMPLFVTPDLQRYWIFVPWWLSLLATGGIVVFAILIQRNKKVAHLASFPLDSRQRSTTER
jgi:hypothetical protein